jgi:uncharacterized protein
MSGQALWAFVIVLVLAAAGLGFFFGRVSNSGMKERVREAEEALGRKDSEMAAYKREVDAHFDKSATLFVSMAGSYKALFEHLSGGYEKLSEGSSRDLFRQRVATLLLDEPSAAAAPAVNAEGPGAAESDAERIVLAEVVVEEVAIDSSDARSDEAEALLADAHPGPVGPAEIAESEELEAQKVDPVQADADAAAAIEEERREPAEQLADEAVVPRRD